ncbi:MAG TPA: ArsR family transcriptional regulator [Clostridiaceae bacterium]|jgi:predicted transcriptional regulator|nr:ArsR family transcriptional regulator [Clostridiaceae bacterium]
MKVTINEKSIELFGCLSSITRIKIIELLSKKPRNISELSDLLGVSSAIVTRHISLMEKVGLITTENLPGKRGLQKICSLKEKEINLIIENAAKPEHSQKVSIPVGQYVAYDVHPVCGLVSKTGPIGLHDDPRYFSDPKHVDAALIWFQHGWVEYRIPSYVITKRALRSIGISLEMCSEYPKYNENWPSDIHFYLNGVLLGVWTSPGDFGEKKGLYTPEWWKGRTEYGLHKTITVTNEGTMLDGTHLSDVKIKDLDIAHGKDIFFRIHVPQDAYHCGGINIFGKGFGNYDQDIEVIVEYDED